MDGPGKGPVVEKPTGGLRRYCEGERKREAKESSVPNSASGRHEVKTSIEARNNTDGGNKMKVMKDLNREAAEIQETIIASLPPRQSSRSGGHGPDGGAESLKSTATLRTAHGQQHSPRKGKRTPTKKRGGKKPKSEEKTAIVKETLQVRILPVRSRESSARNSQSEVSNRFESQFVKKTAFEALQDDASVLRAQFESMQLQQKEGIHRGVPQIPTHNQIMNQDIGQRNYEEDQLSLQTPSIHEPVPVQNTGHSLDLCMGPAHPDIPPTLLFPDIRFRALMDYRLYRLEDTRPTITVQDRK